MELLDIRANIIVTWAMPQIEEKKEEKREEYLYRADPFTFVFRELDLIHNEIREIKIELANVDKRFDDVNKRFDDVNKRFDSMNESVNKRFDDVNKRIDRLYLVVILNLIGIVAFLIKTFFF
jgi:tetrahydromethanopterin S-methyltransferase subunit G